MGKGHQGTSIGGQDRGGAAEACNYAAGGKLFFPIEWASHPVTLPLLVTGAQVPHAACAPTVRLVPGVRLCVDVLFTVVEGSEQRGVKFCAGT